MQMTVDPIVWTQAWLLAQVTALAAAAGWMADRLLDTGVRTRGLSFLAGLFGLYVGRHLIDAAGLWGGPTIAGQPLIGAFLGALGICGFLKLVNLALPRSGD